MTCPACGTELTVGAQRCEACGRELASWLESSEQTLDRPIGPVGDDGDRSRGATPVKTTEPSRPGSTPIAIGQLWASRYDVLAHLGTGGMGSVYKAHDRVLDEAVALKLLKPELLRDPHLLELFKSEIRLARRVRHPNVCSIYEFGEAEQGPYISMELVAGSDLRHVLRERGGGLPARQAFELSIQVAEGLQAVHDVGVVHRDLKSANLMLDTSGRIRLMDFGLAKKESEHTLTTGQSIVGTPAYMSPEQAQGMKVDTRSDIYALGVVIFELFTGRLPFNAPSLALALRHLNDEPPLDDPLVPPALRPVLARALAKQPSDRYATARALARALRAAQADSAVPAPSALGSSVATRPSRRAWPVALLGVLLATAAAGVLRLQPPGPATAGATAAGATPGASPAAKGAPAALLVVVRPWGELLVDGKLVGTTPLDWINVPPGTHGLRVRHPSRGTWEQVVTLEPGERRRLVVDLTASPASRKD